MAENTREERVLIYMARNGCDLIQTDGSLVAYTADEYRWALAAGVFTSLKRKGLVTLLHRNEKMAAYSLTVKGEMIANNLAGIEPATD